MSLALAPEPATSFRNGEGEAKKRSHTPPSCRRATPGAPVGHWRLRCAVAWPTGAQGQGPKGPRAKSLAHRPGKAEPEVSAAVARNDVLAISRPHEPGDAAPGAAAKNPERACRPFPG